MHSRGCRGSGAGRKTRALLTAATMAAAALHSGPSSGQGEAPREAPAAWRVECTGDGKTLDCRAVQQLFQRESRQLVVSMMVRKATDPKGAAVTLMLPLGLNLTEPIQLKIDNGQPEKQSIQTCTNVGCFLVFNANERFVTAMRSGAELKITMQDVNKRTVDIGLPLVGFGLAFDKARS
jgi:invasion protein IalB